MLACLCLGWLRAAASAPDTCDERAGRCSSGHSCCTEGGKAAAPVGSYACFLEEMAALAASAACCSGRSMWGKKRDAPCTGRCSTVKRGTGRGASSPVSISKDHGNAPLQPHPTHTNTPRARTHTCVHACRFTRALPPPWHVRMHRRTDAQALRAPLM